MFDFILILCALAVLGVFLYLSVKQERERIALHNARELRKINALEDIVKSLRDD